MTGLLERILDAALVVVTGFVAVAFVLALLAGLRWLAGRVGAVIRDRVMGGTGHE